MQVSTFGKLKTIFQMGGFGTIFLTLFCPDPWHTNIPAIVGLVCAAGWARSKIAHQTPSTWLLPVASAFAYVALANTMFTPATSVNAQATVIVFMTWGSALVYVYQGYKTIWPQIRMYDAVRLMWTVVYPCCVARWVIVTPTALLPLIFWLGIELIHGGIDNVASAYQPKVTTTHLAASSTLALLFCVFTAATTLSTSPWMLPATWLMCMASALLCTKALWQNRHIFMGTTC